MFRLPLLWHSAAIELIDELLWRARLYILDRLSSPPARVPDPPAAADVNGWEPEVDGPAFQLRKIPGAWYLGVPCAHCDEMVLFAPDLSRGRGALRFLDLDDVVDEPCVRGHMTSFRLDELQRFSWRPR